MIDDITSITECMKKFKSARGLKYHMNLHNGIADYQGGTRFNRNRFSGHGSDRSASPKIVTGSKILTMVHGTTSNLPVFDWF